MKVQNPKTFRIKAKVAQDRGLMRKVLSIMAKTILPKQHTDREYKKMIKKYGNYPKRLDAHEKDQGSFDSTQPMPKKNVIKINCPYCGEEIITTKTRLVRLENEDKAFHCDKCDMNFEVKSVFHGEKIE